MKLGLVLLIVVVGLLVIASLEATFVTIICAPLNILKEALGLAAFGLVMAMPDKSKCGPWAAMDAYEAAEQRRRHDADLLRFEQESKQLPCYSMFDVVGPHYIVTPWGSLAMDYVVAEHGHYLSCERGEMGPRHCLTFHEPQILSIKRRDTGYFEITLDPTFDDGREPGDGHYELGGR